MMRYFIEAKKTISVNIYERALHAINDTQNSVHLLRSQNQEKNFGQNNSRLSRTSQSKKCRPYSAYLSGDTFMAYIVRGRGSGGRMWTEGEFFGDIKLVIKITMVEF